MQLIGERVRKYRRQKGWSQDQLGELVGFSQSKISKIENGDWDSLSDLRLIAKTLGVKLKELIDDEPDGGGSDEKEDAAVDGGS
jgi:transcriptional regulator with XRE-family HTH domain